MKCTWSQMRNAALALGLMTAWVSTVAAAENQHSAESDSSGPDELIILTGVDVLQGNTDECKGDQCSQQSKDATGDEPKTQFHSFTIQLNDIGNALQESGLSEAQRKEVLKALQELDKFKDSKVEFKKLSETDGEVKVQAFQKAATDALKKLHEDVEVLDLNITPSLKTLITRFPRDAVASGKQYRIGVSCREEVVVVESAPERKPTVSVDQLMEDSPAAKAGIRKGDVIVKLNGKDLKSVNELSEQVQSAGKDEKVLVIELLRGDETITVDVKPEKVELFDLTVDLADIAGASQGWVSSSPQGIPRGMAFKSVSGQETSANLNALREDVKGLKKEIAELKEMIRDLKK